MPLSGQELEMAGRLKNFRETLNIKQKEIALGSKTSQGQLSEMEGGIKQIQHRVIFFLAERYGLNVDWLFTGRGEMRLNVPGVLQMVEEPRAKYDAGQIKKLQRQIEELEAWRRQMEEKKA